MEQVSLSLEAREQKGKGPSGRLRASGKLPGILYGLGNTKPITLDPRVIQALLLKEGGRNQILNLKGAGTDGKHALIKEYQVHPLSRQLVHVDLLEIDVKKKIQVTVPLNFVGKSIGVAEGGVLSIIERQVPVKCLPTAIPKHIDVDVTSLKVGASIHFDSITLPEGVEKATNLNPTLVAVVPPTKEEEATASLAPTAEPEVITAKKEEGAEGEAGAAAAGGKEEKKADAKEEKKK